MTIFPDKTFPFRHLQVSRRTRGMVKFSQKLHEAAIMTFRLYIFFIVLPASIHAKGRQQRFSCYCLFLVGIEANHEVFHVVWSLTWCIGRKSNPGRSRGRQALYHSRTSCIRFIFINYHMRFVRILLRYFLKASKI